MRTTTVVPTKGGGDKSKAAGKADWDADQGRRGLTRSQQFQ